MPFRRYPAVPEIVRHSMGLTLAVPEVVAHRVMQMWLAGATPSSRDCAEFQRMWSEKSVAFYESWNAMFLEMFQANVALAMMPVGSYGWAAHGGNTATRVLAAGLAPVHRRAAANAKRLRRGR